MILKQSFKNHLIVSEFTLSMTAILLGAWWYFGYDQSILLVGGLFHLFFTLPAVYLHVEYTIKNWGEEIEINDNKLIVRKNGKEKCYNTQELKEILLFKSASLDKWSFPLSAMEYYHFARITTNSGEEIVITCLLTPNVEKAVKELKEVPFGREVGLGFLCRK